MFLTLMSTNSFLIIIYVFSNFAYKYSCLLYKHLKWIEEDPNGNKSNFIDFLGFIPW